MQILHESIPFLVGLFLPLVLMFVMQASWSSQLKFGVTFVLALVIGACISLLMGELADGLPEGVIAVIIDTSLVYAGSQLAYQLFWKPTLEARIQRATRLKLKRVRE